MPVTTRSKSKSNPRNNGRRPILHAKSTPKGRPNQKVSIAKGGRGEQQQLIAEKSEKLKRFNELKNFFNKRLIEKLKLFDQYTQDENALTFSTKKGDAKLTIVLKDDGEIEFKGDEKAIATAATQYFEKYKNDDIAFRVDAETKEAAKEFIKSLVDNGFDFTKIQKIHYGGKKLEGKDAQAMIDEITKEFKQKKSSGLSSP